MGSIAIQLVAAVLNWKKHKSLSISVFVFNSPSTNICQNIKNTISQSSILRALNWFIRIDEEVKINQRNKLLVHTFAPSLDICLLKGEAR